MILFLYGEDTFRSHQKLAQIKAKFIDASLGDTNLSIADCSDEDFDITQITQMVLAMPFLAKSRLVVIKNLLSDGKKKLQEQVLELIEKVPETTVLVIYESEKVDRRIALFKALNKPKSAQEFKLLEPYELKKWIKGEVENQGGTIDNSAIDKLIEYVGNDLWRLSNEIAKLMAYGTSQIVDNGDNKQLAISDKQVELLVRPKIVANIFDLIDAIGAQNIKKAQSELHKLLNSGENALYIHTMVVYQFRNLLIIKDLLDNYKLQIINYKLNSNLKLKISKQSGLHPFVVEKTMNQTKNYTMDRLKEIYQILLDYDIKMKTGQIEPRLALDLLIVDLV